MTVTIRRGATISSTQFHAMNGNSSNDQQA
jgi:hypothetical protein